MLLARFVVMSSTILLLQTHVMKTNKQDDTMKTVGRRPVSKVKKIKPFTSNETHRHLNLDARQGAVKADVSLNIPDKTKQNSWYMTSSDQIIDNFVAFIDAQNRKSKARIEICINSADDSLVFASACSAFDNQTFDGVLFTAGNEELEEQKAFKTDIRSRGETLRLDILPSSFWIKDGKQSNAAGGGKIGFRFVLQDKEKQIYLSNDPMIIIPDFEPTR